MNHARLTMLMYPLNFKAKYLIVEKLRQDFQVYLQVRRATEEIP